MKEKIIGTINKVESKPINGIFIKSCELIITTQRIIVNFTGKSILTSAMIGNAISGVSGSIAYGTDAKNSNKRNELKNNHLNKILFQKDNYEINYKEINNKSNLKTGFFSTLGLYAPLTIYSHNKKYFFNVPNNQKKLLSNFLKIATNKILLK
jgi:hypothetical protein